MSHSDIMKRKPQYAAPEFWGGEKTVWKDGKPAGKEKVDGWYEHMCWKTIYRAAYRDITIDSQKIDDDYLRLKQMEESYAESEVAREIAENANKETIDVEFDVVDENTSEPETEPEEEAKEEPAAEKEPVTAGAGQQTIEGPGF